MLARNFCSAKLRASLWKTLVSGSLGLVFIHSALVFPGSRGIASLGESQNRAQLEDVSYTTHQFDALRRVSRALRVEKSESQQVRTSVRTATNPLVGLRVGSSWIVGMERMRSQQMKPRSAEAQTLSYEASKKDLAVFRYQVVAQNEEGSTDLEVTPLQDGAAGVNTPALDGHIASIQLRIDHLGRQSSKSYSYIAGLADQQKKVPVSAEGLRSKLTAFELFPLDWPGIGIQAPGSSRESAAGLRTARSTVPDLALPSGLQELVHRSTYAKAEGASRARTRALPDAEKRTYQGTDFFGRPVDLVFDGDFAWPTWMKTAHGVAVLLQVESSDSR